jgi:hypothetical protein
MQAPCLKDAINGYGEIQRRATKVEMAKRATDKALAGFDGPTPTEWPPEQVGKFLTDAFRIVHRLPKPKGPRGYGSNWPAIVRDADDLAGISAEDKDELQRLALKRIPPTASQLQKTERVLVWLDRLRSQDAEQATMLMYWADAMASKKPNLQDGLCKRKGWGYGKFCHSTAEAKEWISEELRAGKLIF